MRYLLLLINLLISFNVYAYNTTNDVRALRLFNDLNIVSTQYYDFCLDHSGYLWIASSSGLVRFDGSNIEVFRHDDDVTGSISSNTVNKVMCDSHGNIWVGTADGLYSFDPKTETFTLVPIPADGLNGYIIDLTEQADGTIVFMVSGVGLFVVDKSSGKPEGVKLGYSQEHSEMNSLISTLDGGLITGNHNGDLFRIWANGNMKRYSISHDFFIGLRKETDESILAFTTHGIWRINPSTMDTTPIDISSLGETPINNICIGKDGTVYIATNGNGLWAMETGGSSIQPILNLYNPGLNINKSNIGTVYMAPDGNLWIGCNYHGVLLAPSTPMPFKYYPLSPMLKDFHGGISATAADKDGLWLAFERGEAVHMSHNHEILHHLRLPSDHEIRSMGIGGDGMLYAVTSNDALWQINPATCTHKRLLDINSSCIRYYTTIGGGDFQTLFLGMRGDGVLKYDLVTGEETLFTTKNQGEDRLHNNWIASTYIDSQSRLWVGLFSGLACYDIQADTFKIINQTPYIKGSCNAFGEMHDGNILIGTSNGLLIYNPDNDKVLKSMTSIDGLVDNHVRTIEIDSKGRAWIGTYHGITYFDPSTGRLTSLQGGYGLSEITVMHSAYNKETDRMFLIGNLGYTQFNPSSITPVKFTAPIAVTGVYINGRKITESHMTNGRQTIITDSLSRCHRINISHKDNNLVLRLSPMDFRDPSNLIYEWMIDNDSDGSWITTRSGNSSIVIPDLDPGTHTLLIRAVDNDVYSDTSELTIYVSPPWYLTTIAKIFYLLVVMSILALIYILIQKQNNEKINEAKVRFFMNISHEIRSPVTCIINPLQTLLRKNHDQETTAMLKTMQRNADRILSLANQLLELRKIDKGKKRLSMQKTELKGFALELVELFRPVAEKKSIEISLDAPYEIPDLWVDRTNFDKVLVNLITNAIKYTPDGGRIVVRLSTGTDAVLGNCANISVIDTGIGLDQKNISRIFDRFYQGQGSGSASGFGVGLDLARQLVTLHHGTLTAANRNDGIKGSVFTVQLPLGKAHLQPEEIAIDDTSPLSVHPVTVTPRQLNEDTISTDKTDDPISKSRKRHIGRRILIVDDDTELRRYMCMHFSRNDKVFEASNGVEAKKILLSHKVDIVVSDVVMPEIDGLELLKAIKSNSETTHMPVILLSSRIDIADRMAGWDRGADGYIGKPFDVTELDAMINNLIDNRLRLKGKFSGAQDTDKKMVISDIKGNDEILMDKIMKAINSRIDDPQLNVEELGIEVGISRAHLHRKMKELIGMTPSDFIRNVRLRKACEILKKPDVDITQVAYKLGFTSQPHFSTAFKKFTGVTPSEYRSHNAE